MKTYKYFAMGTVLLAATSCSDFLTPESKSSLDAEAMLVNESAINDAYYSLRAVYANGEYRQWFQAGTDLYSDGRNPIPAAYNTYTLNPSTEELNKSLYEYCFKGIRSAYAVVYYSGGIPEANRQKRVDEARVIAANYYYLLVNSYGGVPIIKEFINTPEREYARASAQEVYEYIINELLSVIENNALDATNATAGGGRVSMEAAKGLLAKTYLAAAWDLNNNEYFAKAAQYADEVINASAAKGLPTEYANLYKADGSGDDNAEFIWDVEYDLASANNKSAGGHSISSYYCNYIGGSEDNVKAMTSMYVPTLYALQCFKKGDKRYDATFMKELPDVKNGSAYGYWTWYEKGESLVGVPVVRYYPAWYETDADIAAWRAIDPTNRANTYIIPMAENSKEAQIMSGNAKNYYEMIKDVFGGSACKKFDDSQTASTAGDTDYRDIHIITLPDLYLVAAEAYLKAGNNTEALNRLNVVHKRACGAELAAVSLDAILEERACEFFGNDQRWIDLSRTKTLKARYTAYNYQETGTVKWLRPIPQYVIDINNAITQNPEYVIVSEEENATE
ncbi:MAG: RagB/SusD family nutrient uptake outer membrane protein [Prevotella sp.]|nr:RagB/SusD family nutrient uptake outer membrane protein [Prevotella sp.]